MDQEFLIGVGIRWEPSPFGFSGESFQSMPYQPSFPAAIMQTATDQMANQIGQLQA